MSGRTAPALRKGETRRRLREVATRLFAERGFRKVTVRDIAREAHANLAAVSYHFRDKLGLYMEVVRSGIETVRGPIDETMLAKEGSTAEERLRHYIRRHVEHVVNRGVQPMWIQRLAHHEMNDPSPAAEFIWQQLLRPRMRYLSEVVGELLDLPPSDERVARCALSIHAQCLFYARNPFREMALPQLRASTRAQVDAVASHIIDFSLGGLRAIAGATAKRGRER